MTLKAKYRSKRGTLGYPAKPRTGNSHGPNKGRKKNGKINHIQYVMVIHAGSGKRRMVRA